MTHTTDTDDRMFAERLTARLDGMRPVLTPLRDASADLHAAIAFVAPTATGWRYLSADRVGVIVDEPNGSRREISGDELNRAYALLADVHPCEMVRDVLARHPNCTAAVDARLVRS